MVIIEGFLGRVAGELSFSVAEERAMLVNAVRRLLVARQEAGPSAQVEESGRWAAGQVRGVAAVGGPAARQR